METKYFDMMLVDGSFEAAPRPRCLNSEISPDEDIISAMNYPLLHDIYEKEFTIPTLLSRIQAVVRKWDNVIGCSEFAEDGDPMAGFREFVEWE